MRFPEDNDAKFSVSFGCPGKKKCLAWIKLKMQMPWLVHVKTQDGTTIVTGDTIRVLKYGSFTSKMIKRTCALCRKANKQKHR